MAIYESGEDYLEAILLLQQKHGYVRNIDIANKFNYSKPSVTRAVRVLKSLELVKIDEKGHITLTDEGMTRACEIYSRHMLLVEFYRDVLGVDEETAEEDACHTEHAVSQKTVKKLREFVKNYVEKEKAKKK